MRVPLLAVAILSMGCPSTDIPIEPSGDALPDFSLPDVNSNSTRFNQPISPRDYLGEVSAWYFGHAT